MLTDTLDIFKAVQASRVSFGVAPFENSSNGPVSQTLDCLIDREDEFSDVYVDGEVYLDVQHCLLGHRRAEARTSNDDSVANVPAYAQETRSGPEQTIEPSPARPPADLSQIADVYSHPQALGQCQNFILTCLKGARQHETSSTSHAAEIIAPQASSSSAAISSRLAADMYGLSLLAENIQDAKDNTTRFFILRKRFDLLAEPRASSEQNSKWKAVVIFSIRHEAPGALAEALLVFKNQGLNLTNLSNRPNRLRPWHYTFVVECEYIGTGHAGQRQIQDALQTLEEATESRKCMGFWQEDKERLWMS